MCVDVDEPFEALWSREALAAEGQHCGECSRLLDIGESHCWERLGPVKHRRCTDESCDHDTCNDDEEYIDDTEASEWHFCFQCLAARVWLERVCHAWLYGGVFEDLEGHTYEIPPIASLPLSRLVVGMRRKWRRWDGSLYDPTVVEGWANAGAQLVEDHLKAQRAA